MILEIHRVDFPQASKPILPKPVSPDLNALVDRREKEELAGISLLKRSLRKEAKARARELATEDLRREMARLEADRTKAQAELEDQWARLNANDPDAVIAVVDQAFEDNEAPAAPVNVEGATLSLVVLTPGIEDVPERKPALTPSGKVTIKKMTKQERSDMYLTLVCGHLLATVKEALAEAPGISHVKAVVVRQSGSDVYGSPRMEALLVARYARSDLDRVKWKEALPSDIAQEAAEELLWDVKGRQHQLQALDLDEEPDLRSFLDVLSDRMFEPSA